VARKKRPPTLAEVAIGNAGFRKTILAFEFMQGWGLVSAGLGREPTNIDEYAELIGCDRATAYRHRSAFLKAFPNEENPSRLNEVTGQNENYKTVVSATKDLAAAYRDGKATLFTLGAGPLPM
jgi:hypothetical protein